MPEQINRLNFKSILGVSKYSIFGVVALILGFIRELIVAKEFGTSESLDVYVAVLTFHLFFGTQVGNTIEMAFLPEAVKIDHKRDIAGVLFGALKRLLTLDVVVVSLLYLSARVVLEQLFPSFTQSQQALGTMLLSGMLLTTVLANCSGLFRGGLNGIRVFLPGLLASPIISVVSIVALLLFAQDFGVLTLLGALIIGNALVLSIMVVTFVRKVEGEFVAPPIQREKVLRHIWRGAAIVFVGEVGFQSYVLCTRIFAATLEPGTISSFFFAATIVAVPISIFIWPISTVLYPQLARNFQNNRRKGYEHLVGYGVPAFLLAAIVATGVAFFSEELVRAVFMRGEFNEMSVKRTAPILAILIFSLPFGCIARILDYALYAISRHDIPSISKWIGFVSFLITVVPLVDWLGAKGLALAMLIALILPSVVSFLNLKNLCSGTNGAG